MPVRFSRVTRLMSSISRCTRLTRGSTMTTMRIIITSRAATKPAVMTDRVQLLLTILMTAHTAITGALMRI